LQEVPKLPEVEDVASPAPSPVGGEPWTTAVCWNCGTPSPNLSNDVCLNPACRRSLVPPALVVTFQDGQLELQRGDTLMLGRLGRHADKFLSYPNVSREHACIGVEADGRAWVKPRPVVNGTFVNEREVDPDRQHDLRNQDTLRLGRDCKGTVRVFAFER
jgi:hypothetical protein